VAHQGYTKEASHHDLLMALGLGGKKKKKKEKKTGHLDLSFSQHPNPNLKNLHLID
jgi:hypothetical protein